MFGHCFVLQYFVAFLVLKSERELVAFLLLCSACHVVVVVL